MATQTTIQRIGRVLGLKIPAHVLDRHHLAEGDRVHIIETKDGLLITPCDPDVQEAMAFYEEGAKDYRDALRKLA
jgi:antitoxin MazE